VITDHDHLLLVGQIDADDRVLDRHQRAESIQSRVSVAVTPQDTITVTHERPPPAMGHQARSASGGRSFVLHRHAERLSMPLSRLCRIPVVSVDLVQLTAAERSVAHKIDSIMQMYERRSRTAVFNLSSSGPRRHAQL
jgi:hypothetical protein